MVNKNCPKCNSDLIFISEGGGIGANGWHQKVLMDKGTMYPTEDWQTRLCGNCGYFENYLRDEAMLTKIVSGNASGWRKLED